MGKILHIKDAYFELPENGYMIQQKVDVLYVVGR